MKKPIAIMVLASILTACSSTSKDIVPAHVSTIQYSNYDCDQLRQEAIRIQGRVNELSGKLDKNRENDNLTTAAGLVLFWPALFFLGGTKEQESEYARLKGEYNAVSEVAVQKKCIVK